MGHCQGCFAGAFFQPAHEAALLTRHARISVLLKSRIAGERIYGLQAVGCLNARDAIAAGHVDIAATLLQDCAWSVRHAAVSLLLAIPGAAEHTGHYLVELTRSMDLCVRLLAISIIRSCFMNDGTFHNVERTNILEMLASSEDKATALKAAQTAGECLKYVGEELRADREVVCAAVQQCGQSLRHASSELRGDRAVVLEAVVQDGLALQHASMELRRDAQIVGAAVGQNEASLCFAHEEVRCIAFMMEIAEQSDEVLEHWNAKELIVFNRFSSEHSPQYITKRPEFIELIRNLATALEVPDVWGQALGMLDAFHCLRGFGEFVARDIAIAAVMLAGRLANAKLNYRDHEAMIAIHFGRGYKLNEADLQALFSAEIQLCNGLQGCLLFPTTSEWIDLIFRRMAMFAGSHVANSLCEVASIAQQVAEILILRVPASAKTSPRRLAVCACVAGLMSAGMLPIDELRWPMEDQIVPIFTSRPWISDDAAACEKSLWPKRQAASDACVNLSIFTRAVNIDKAILQEDVLATVSAL